MNANKKTLKNAVTGVNDVLPNYSRSYVFIPLSTMYLHTSLLLSFLYFICSYITD